MQFKSSWTDALEEAKKDTADGRRNLNQPIEYIAEMAQMERNYEYVKRRITNRIYAILKPNEEDRQYYEDEAIIDWVFPYESDGRPMRQYFSHRIKHKLQICNEDWYKKDFSKLLTGTLDKAINECARYVLRKYRELKEAEWEDYRWMFHDD